jgi:hypothetical protein
VNPIPDRIARLPRDKRGYPIPWNVQIGKEDTPLFTVNDQEKHIEAILRQLCPICGERLGRWRWFVGGILSAFDPNGAYYDLCGHHECETFALQVCPYLSAPKYLGRLDVIDPSKIPDGMTTTNITMIPERPEIFVAVASDKFQVSAIHESDTPVIRPQRPYLAYEFWRHGVQLTEEEALPILREVLGASFKLPALRA